MDTDPTHRFDGKAAVYHRYRPDYPDALIRHLAERGLRDDHAVADIGSGTGILSRRLLGHAERVFAVEPNPAMRHLAEEELGLRDDFHSIPGCAEETFLADRCVGLICCAQAFHWFDLVAFRRECQRILLPDGQVAIIWNEWELVADAVSTGYEGILRRHAQRRPRDATRRVINRDTLEQFYGHAAIDDFSCPNPQRLDLDGLIGRMCSSSNAPRKGTAEYTPMIHELDEFFADHADDDGLITLAYTCRCYSAPVR